MGDYIGLLFKKFYSDFQHFIFTNNILITASGFTIGFATNNLINQNLQLFTPFFASLYNILLNIDKCYIGLSNYIALSTFLSSVMMFSLNIIVWIFTVFFTFILLEYVMNNQIFGLKSILKESDEKDFIVSKTAAKQKNIIPVGESLHEVKLQEKKEEIIGDKILKNKEEKFKKDVVDIIEKDMFTSDEKYQNFMIL